MRDLTKTIVWMFIVFMVFNSAVFGMTYFRVLVDGSESDTQIQGQSQTFEMDCGSSGAVIVTFYSDIDSSGTIDTGEYPIFQMNFEDNATGFPADSDPTVGIMSFDWPLHYPPGCYVLEANDDADTLELTYTVSAPDPLLRSVSGTVVMDGITPPDDILTQLPFMAGTMSPPLLMYFLPDTMGNYSFNWPGGDDTISFMLMGNVEGYEFDGLHPLLVDGHIADLELHFSRLGLSYLTIYIDSVENDTQMQGELLEIEMNCAPTEPSFIYVDVIVDINGNGVIDDGEPSFFAEPWSIEDNGWDEFPGDNNYESGIIRAVLPNLPPGNYVLYATDSIAEVDAPLTVEAPSPLTMSISGTVSLETITAPDSILDGIVIIARSSLDIETMYYCICDSMGNFTCNWASGSDNIDLFFAAPYVSEEWAFVAETLNIDIDGFETGADFSVGLSSYPDSILINFETDSGGWEIMPHEIEATYIDPITHEVFDTRVFPDSGDIYIPVRPDSCGIVFRATDTVYFYDHNFISPFDTLWISETVYPSEFDVYADQTNYHFLLYFDNFELDSVPIDGISVELYGTDSLGHEYYTDFHVFIELYDSVYLVASERELCDGDWTLVIPDTLPGNYIPSVTETTFNIPEVPDWPWYGIHIPVGFDDITEKQLPKKMEINIHPNPFNSSVAVGFYMEQSGNATVAVYNMMGELVNTLIDGIIQDGNHSAIWNGTDANGMQTPSGIYFFRISTRSETKILKGLYIR